MASESARISPKEAGRQMAGMYDHVMREHVLTDETPNEDIAPMAVAVVREMLRSAAPGTTVTVEYAPDGAIAWTVTRVPTPVELAKQLELALTTAELTDGL